MARDKVRSRKGLGHAGFERVYGAEKDATAAWRVRFRCTWAYSSA